MVLLQLLFVFWLFFFTYFGVMFLKQRVMKEFPGCQKEEVPVGCLSRCSQYFLEGSITCQV